MKSDKKNNKRVPMIRSILICSLLLTLTAATAHAYTPPGAAALQDSAASYLMRDGVVVDPARSALYVMQKDGITAVGHSGEALWTSEQAERPIGLFGDQLVALLEPATFGVAELAWLDVRSGELLRTISVPLPEDVGAWVVDRPNQSFDAKLRVAGGQLQLFWSYTGRPLVGAQVVATDLPRTVKRDGVMILDPAGGLTKPSTATPSAAPALGFELTQQERMGQIPGRQFRTADDRHLLGSEKISSSDGWNRYRWTLAGRDGNVLGTVDRPVSTASFMVAGTTLIHESTPYMRRLPSGDFEARGLSLVGADLRNGRELWTLEIRDTVYRGILPP